MAAYCVHQRITRRRLGTFLSLPLRLLCLSFWAIIAAPVAHAAPIIQESQPTPPPQTDDPNATPAPEAPAFTPPTAADIWQEWRNTNTQNLVNSPVSPLTISDRTVLRQGQQNAVRPAPQRAGNWQFDANPTGAITLEFSRLGRLIVKAEGQERQLASQEGLDLVEDLHITWTKALPYEDRAQVFLHDRDHLGLRSYAELVQWFDYDPAYSITGTFIAQESSRATYITNRAGVTMVVYRIGIWETRWNGLDVKLSVFAESRNIDASSKLWIWYTDESNGSETSKSGRFIDYLIYGDVNAEMRLRIDFNYTVAPFCDISTQLSCPVINRNHIPVPVLVGEKLPTAKLPTERPRTRRRPATRSGLGRPVN